MGACAASGRRLQVMLPPTIAGGLRSPFRLDPVFKNKVWGSLNLSPWFADPTEPIGEVWFTANENQTSTGKTLGALIAREGETLLGSSADAAPSCPILIKFLFTSERLSVQVHPDDPYAATHHQSRGKTEAWHILRADSDARIALGFREALSQEKLLASSQSGEIEQLLDWIPARPGQTLFAPAGTVHAIGPGIALCEIQQNSDVTYRLFDYGRPRELHLEHAARVARLSPCEPQRVPSMVSEGRELLCECPHFSLERLTPKGALRFRPDGSSFYLLVVASGSGLIGSQDFRAGEVWFIPAASEAVEVNVDAGSTFLAAYCGGAPSPQIEMASAPQSAEAIASIST